MTGQSFFHFFMYKLCLTLTDHVTATAQFMDMHLCSSFILYCCNFLKKCL